MNRDNIGIIIGAGVGVVVILVGFMFFFSEPLGFLKNSPEGLPKANNNDEVDKRIQSALTLCRNLELALKDKDKQKIKKAESQITLRIDDAIEAAYNYWNESSVMFKKNFLSYLGSQRNKNSVRFLYDHYGICEEPRKRIIVNSLARISGSNAFKSILWIHKEESSYQLRRVISDSAISICNPSYLEIIEGEAKNDTKHKEFYTKLKKEIKKRSEFTKSFGELKQLKLSDENVKEKLLKLIKENPTPAFQQAVIAKIYNIKRVSLYEIILEICVLNDPNHPTSISNHRSVRRKVYQVLFLNKELNVQAWSLLQRLTMDYQKEAIDFIELNYKSEFHKAWLEKWHQDPLLNQVKDKIRTVLKNKS